MTDAPSMSISVAQSTVATQVKAQLRIGLAALAGIMVGKHLLPAAMNNDALLDALCALIFGGIASVWQLAVARLQHSQLWRLAIDPRVPDDLVSAAPSHLSSAFTPIDPPPAALAQPKEHDMSLKTFLVQIEDSAMADLKAAGTILENIFITESQKVVAELKQLPIAATGMNIISALESNTSSGTEKMDILVSALATGIKQVQAAGGISGLVTTVEDLAKEFGQSLYNDFAAVAQKALGGGSAATTA